MFTHLCLFGLCTHCSSVLHKPLAWHLWVPTATHVVYIHYMLVFNDLYNFGEWIWTEALWDRSSILLTFSLDLVTSGAITSSIFLWNRFGNTGLDFFSEMHFFNQATTVLFFDDDQPCLSQDIWQLCCSATESSQLNQENKSWTVPMGKGNLLKAFKW